MAIDFPLKMSTRMVLTLSIAVLMIGTSSTVTWAQFSNGSNLPVMKALDGDGDGQLSVEEIANAPAALRLLDDDGDGALSKMELSPGFGKAADDWDDWGDFGGGGRDVAVSIPDPEDLDFSDGTATIADAETFARLSYKSGMVMPHLKGHHFVKFQIEEEESDHPKLYFINTETHPTHFNFLGAIGKGRGGWGMRGVLVDHPLLIAPNGEIGLYSFEFDLIDEYPLQKVQMALGLLERASPLLRGRLAYQPIGKALELYRQEKQRYESVSLPVFLEEDRFKGIGFLPLNIAESYGRLRTLALDERPSPRDIVIYETLPNELPPVAGVISGSRQTPLSHVNLRAVQDGIANAFILGGAQHREIAPLIGKYVRYSVSGDDFEITEATVEEVNSHFEKSRPRNPQTPQRDLSVDEIGSLDAIAFDALGSFGGKAANLAELRTLGFPEGMIPRGYAIPFSFYHRFMEHNGFYEQARAMMDSSEFSGDTARREAALATFRQQIREGEMPPSLLDAIGTLERSFPEGLPLRCRSSASSEDLPGFSGAGLYDSFTHHNDEGHLARSIQQVYASLWSFRAFEERTFHRIDHLLAAMGVLVHPNYSGELANGVAVSEDILYQTTQLETGRSYYINCQVGEDLVTLPGKGSIPEEMLLSPRFPREDVYIRSSNLIPRGKELLDLDQRNLLRSALKRIHRHFRTLHGKQRDDRFAMEIEFKITAEGALVVKQARPWVYSR